MKSLHKFMDSDTYTLRKKYNLSYIMMRIIKVYSNHSSSFIYANILTMLFKKEKIHLLDEPEKVKLRESYVIYNEKILGWIIHIVCKNGAWDFKYPRDKGFLCLVKPTALKSVRKPFKVS